MMDFANEGQQDVLAMETSDGRRRFFAGDSLQQALVQAANYFNLDPEYVAYKSLEKRHGFLKVRRKVVIEVDPDNPRREKPQAIPAAERPTPPVVGGNRPGPANGAGQPSHPGGQKARGPRRERPGGGHRHQTGGEDRQDQPTAHRRPLRRPRG